MTPIWLDSLVRFHFLIYDIKNVGPGDIDNLFQACDSRSDFLEQMHTSHP